MDAAKVTAPPPPPAKVWVVNHEFPITLVPRGDPRLKDDGEEEQDNDGLTNWTPLGIFIADDLKLRGLLETVLHEIQHAIHWAYGIADDEDDRANCNEEHLSDVNGKAWTVFAIDNPKFERWKTRIVNLIRKEQKDA